MNYPLISEYEIEIKRQGSSVLDLDDEYIFIPSQTKPIKIFNYGSGAFASVFKVLHVPTNKEYALRVFLSGANPKNINRVFEISEGLKDVSCENLSSYKLFNHSIVIKNKSYPVILMDWVNGIKINNYVTSILHDNTKLQELQAKIVELSHKLESLGIAHGDIQSGNIIISQSYGQDLKLNLVDYDPMFLPILKGKTARELGHSSFQHPKRNKSFFNEQIDRFSFWLLLTSIEAIKFDKTLWGTDVRSGFNDGDNFLFRASDIANADQSKLVQKLRSLKQESINFYLDNLFSNPFSPERDKVELCDIKISENIVSVLENKEIEKKYNERDFIIESSPTGAKIYHDNKLLGKTPISLEYEKFVSKKITIFGNNDFQRKTFYLNGSQKKYYINLTDIPVVLPTPPKTDYLYKITSNPTNATVRNSDGDFLGTTPLTLTSKNNSLKVDIQNNNGKTKHLNLNSNQQRYHVDFKEEEDNKDYTKWLGFFIFLVIIIVGIIIVAIDNNRYVETVEVPNSLDTAAVAVWDASADTMALQPEQPLQPTQPLKENIILSFEDLGVNKYSDNTSYKPHYDGCGTYLSMSKEDFENGIYITTGFSTSYFNHHADSMGSYLELLINGEIERFDRIESSRSGDEATYINNNGMTLKINLKIIDSGYEFFMYEGTIELIKNNEERATSYVYGSSGC